MVHYVKSENNIADILTKTSNEDVFENYVKTLKKVKCNIS